MVNSVAPNLILIRHRKDIRSIRIKNCQEVQQILGTDCKLRLYQSDVTRMDPGNQYHSGKPSKYYLLDHLAQQQI